MGKRSRRRLEPTESDRPSRRWSADNIRRFLLGIGQIGIEIGGLAGGGTGGTHDDGSAGASDGHSPPARTWYGRILQWAWALLILLVGLACFVLALLLAVGWVMSWFD